MRRVDPRLIALLAVYGGQPELRRREHEWRKIPGLAAFECTRCGKRIGDLEGFGREVESECRGKGEP